MVLVCTQRKFRKAQGFFFAEFAIQLLTLGSSALKLSEATAVSAEFGMTGKLCLMPEQVAAVNEGLSPSLAELSWATDFLKEFKSTLGDHVFNNASEVEAAFSASMLAKRVMAPLASRVCSVLKQAGIGVGSALEDVADEVAGRQQVVVTVGPTELVHERSEHDVRQGRFQVVGA